MKHLLIIAYSDLENDPRVYRQVRYLKERYKITTIGWEPIQIEGVKFYPIRFRQRSPLTRLKHAVQFKLRMYEKLHWVLYDFETLLEQLKEKTFDLVIANDVEAMPLAAKLAGDVPIICDLHEYAPAQFAHQFRWRLLYQAYTQHLCHTWLKKCAHLFTVSQGISDEYYRVFRVRPEVLTNAPVFRELLPSPVKNRSIRLIHHGCAQASRKIERMIEVMKHTDSRFSLDIMLVPGSEEYIDHLKEISSQMDNVQFLPPVPMVRIPEFINDWDIGMYFLEPVNFNYKHALPNKIFEFIQARLALLIGPTPGMAGIVREYGCGIVADSFEPREIADLLNSLTVEDIHACKQKSHIAAGRLNAEKNMEQLNNAVTALTTGANK